MEQSEIKCSVKEQYKTKNKQDTGRRKEEGAGAFVLVVFYASISLMLLVCASPTSAISTPPSAEPVCSDSPS